MDFTTCSKRWLTRVDDNMKALKNIANFGLNVGERAKVMRHGEYHGIEIEAIEPIYPLLTSERINKVYQMYLQNDVSSIINYIQIQKEYLEFGNDIVHYVIKKWCEKTHVKVPDGILDVKIDKTNLEELNLRITRNVSHEIVGKFKLVGIGTGEKTGEPIIPHDWISMEFKGGEDLHAQMNLLPSRLGKPPVTYCCTYGMMIEPKQNIKENYDKLENFFVIENATHGMKSEIYSKINNSNKCDTILKNKSKYNILRFNGCEKFKALLFIEKSIITESKNQNSLQTSYLCSLLQKCFRNEFTGRLLTQTINNLHYSKGYNLPDQHFAKVSGPKQLCWRAYISIIEDVNSYFTNTYMDLLDLLMLSLVFNELPNMQLNHVVLEQLKKTLKLVQIIDKSAGWRECEEKQIDTVLLNHDGPNLLENRAKNSVTIALNCVNMMQGDRKMLSKFYNYVKNDSKHVHNIDIFNKLLEENDSNIELDTRAIAYDMHCYPNILIELQGSLPFVPNQETLQMLSSFIWDNSSSYNTRYERKKTYLNEKYKHILRTLYDVQYYHITHNKKIWIEKKNVVTKTHYDINHKYNQFDGINEINEQIKRNAFLLVFGRVYRLDKKIGGKVHNIVICGDNKNVTKVKLSSGKSATIYVEGKDRFLAEKEFVKQFQTDGDFIDFKTINAPVGWKWKKDLNGKVKLSMKLISSDEKTMTNTIEFSVGKYTLNPFDGYQLLEKDNAYMEEKEIPERLQELISIALYLEHGDIYDNLIELHLLSKQRYLESDKRIFNWLTLFNPSCLPVKVILYVRARILMNVSSTITVGPCDRSGGKTNNSISYDFEGVIWRMLILLSALYPQTLKPNSLFNYTLDKSNYSYTHMINSLNSIVLKGVPAKFDSDVGLKTTLWDHQERSVKKIVDGFYVKGLRGFGDASGVGTGKTLVALSVIINLYNLCKNDKKVLPNSGFLVMLPTEGLYSTWKEEIKKHTSGIDLQEQLANGKIIKSFSQEVGGNINANTIVITTMGRCRDHPIIHQWMLTVIDECLTVQNKEALQTEEAWRQSSYSYFGVLMLSATFFRSRFDKMTYMLNMLNDTLPKTSEYLDTILSESIVCNLNENERKWTTNINYYELDIEQRKAYLKILAKKDVVGAEKVYTELEAFIRSEIDYIQLFVNTIEKIESERPNSRILIYTNSKAEADKLSTVLPNKVSRFSIPLENQLNSHIVLSYAEGTFGLNNLTNYNTILTRPPEPDKLPQMKGRLDRPGQSVNELNLEYILIKETIEEVGLIRLEVCKNFYGNYIMPLAEMIKIGLNIG